jgi:hypothetical protein
LAKGVQVEDKSWAAVMFQQLLDANGIERCIWMAIYLNIGV